MSTELATYEPAGNGQMTLATEERAARAVAEVQASLAIAKRFPRDENTAIQRMMTSCKRQRFAESAMYSYPKGGTRVVGPSIRMAEMLAQNWGNMSFGIREIENGEGESTIEAYCHDFETNVRREVQFTVKHSLKKKDGSFKHLDDPRDVYEMVANQGARRLRACILAVIPGDVVEDAIDMVQKTLTGSNDTPIEDRIRKMLTAFKPHGVTKGMIEKRLGHNIESTSEIEMVDLVGVFNSLKDGASKVTDWFDHELNQQTAEPGEANRRLEEEAPKPNRKKSTRKKQEEPKPPQQEELPVFDEPPADMQNAKSPKDVPSSQPAKPVAPAQGIDVSNLIEDLQHVRTLDDLEKFADHWLPKLDEKQQEDLKVELDYVRDYLVNQEGEG